MKSMIRALAAIGAALVFAGCGAPTTVQDGDVTWSLDPDTGERAAVVAIDGYTVPDHFDTEALLQKQADESGVSLEELRKGHEDAAAKLMADTAAGFDNDIDADALIKDPPDLTRKATSHHPTYRYGVMGLGSDLDHGTFPNMYSCTCNGPEGAVGNALPSSVLGYSCTNQRSGDHETNSCLFPGVKSWTIYMGDSTTWGNFDNLLYMRARMAQLLSHQLANTGFTFVTSTSRPPESARVISFVPSVGTPAYFGHTALQGHASDEGDLPIRNAQSQRNAKAYSYGTVAIMINNNAIERISDQQQRNAGILPPFDFTNAYENVLAHELGHAMGIPHFTTDPRNRFVPLMLPGCAGRSMLGSLAHGGQRGDFSFFAQFGTIPYNPNSSRNTEQPLLIGDSGNNPRSFSKASDPCGPASDGSEFDWSSP